MNPINQLYQKIQQEEKNALHDRVVEAYRLSPRLAELDRMRAALVRKAAGREIEPYACAVQLRSLSAEEASILKSLGLPPDFLKLHYRCEKCSDTGFTDRAMCDCMKRLINKIASDELNRDANMPNADFAHFDTELYRGVNINGIEAHKLMSNVLSFCKGYAENFSSSSPSLLMIGDPGLGKTHLSVSIAKEVINR